MKRLARRSRREAKQKMASGNAQGGEATDLSAAQLADRLAIRGVLDAYAFCADRRDATGQMGLFTEDTEFLVYMDSRSPSPTQHLRGRAALFPVFDELNTYEATMHFNGQSTVELDGEHATGVTYCVAYHVKVGEVGRSLMTAAIRYLDSFVKQDGTWLFDQRKLIVVWTETRPLSAD
jgi:hypothetical protein